VEYWLTQVKLELGNLAKKPKEIGLQRESLGLLTATPEPT